MKQIIISLFLIILFASCQQNETPAIRQEAGIVYDYAGIDHCRFVIELDNGKKIQPHYYPEEFVFYQGQRLLVRYAELPNSISTCGKGVPSDVIYVEEIFGGDSLTEIELQDYNNFSNDPVYIHLAFVKDDFLHLKVSFSGGCRNHDFNLLKINGGEQEENTALLELRHNANGDMCEAALSKELRFSLASLKDEGYTKFLFKAMLEDGSTYIELFLLE